MKTTANYGLKKPETSDFYNVDDFNENAEILDGLLALLAEQLKSAVNALSAIQETAEAAGLAADAAAKAAAEAKSAADGSAAAEHSHAAADIKSGTLDSVRLPVVPISKGGTGATTAAAALANLGLSVTVAELNRLLGVQGNVQEQIDAKAPSSHEHAISDVTGLQTTLDGKAASSHNHSASNITSGTLPVARGGTGVATLTALLKSLFPSSATATYIPVFGSSWGSAGYTNPTALRNAMGLGNTTGALPVTNGGTGATTAAAARTALGAASTATYTATVTTTWTASGDYFYQDIAVSGILATDEPTPAINPGSDNAANLLYDEAFGKVFRITTSANSIRVWATEAISTAFPIRLKVVR